MANADFTKRLEGNSFEAESILSQTIGYRPRLFDAELGLAQPKRTSDRGSALSGTGRWLPAEHDLATEASISDWHLGCIVAFGRMTVMEWIVLGFLLILLQS